MTGLSIERVFLNYPLSNHEFAPYLISIGPKTLVIPRGGAGDLTQAGVKELFNPHASPVIDGLTISGVHVSDPDTPGRYCRLSTSQLAEMINVRRKQQLAGYASSMQPGTTGEGNLLNAHLE